MKIEVTTNSLKETIDLGQKIGTKLKGGEVIELISDLGGGKTSITTGIVAGAGSQDLVSSPSFTISYLYATPKFNIHHFDFYRLEDPGVVKLSLSEAISEKNDVIIVEWGDIVSDVLPASRITIKLKLAPEDYSKRLVEIDAPEEFNYIVDTLSNWRGAGGEVNLQ